MKAEWKQFLMNLNATADNNGVHDYGDLDNELQLAQTQDCVADLTGFSLIEVAGADAEKFLQGQFTCDVSQASTNQAKLGACCDHKGRVIANFYIWRFGDKFRLMLPVSMAELLIAHLSRYAVFSKVTLSHCEAELHAISLFGPSTAEIINNIPETENLQIIKDSYNRQYLICCNYSALIKVCEQFLKALSWVGYPVYRAKSINNGVAFIYPATSGQFVPQMIGLQFLDGISFKKGCYVGQEVVARTQHLGKLKRHLYQFQLDTKTLPKPSDSLCNEAKQVLGVITVATPDVHGGVTGLAVIQDRAAEETLFFNEYPIAQLTRCFD